MTLRKWKYEDILKISELENECFSDPWTYKMFADAFASDYFLGVLAEEDEEIIGYACGTSLFENAETGSVAVAEDYRNKGLGNKLLKALEMAAKKKGAEVMLLEVRVSNSPALKLYLKRGYVGLYARPRYYLDGEDALVMKKQL